MHFAWFSGKNQPHGVWLLDRRCRFVFLNTFASADGRSARHARVL